jgi:hypothetical protein
MLIKAGPSHRSARRSAQIIVDDLDIAKPATLCFVHEFVLATLALEVYLDLGLRALS